MQQSRTTVFLYLVTTIDQVRRQFVSNTIPLIYLNILNTFIKFFSISFIGELQHIHYLLYELLVLLDFYNYKRHKNPSISS